MPEPPLMCAELPKNGRQHPLRQSVATDRVSCLKGRLPQHKSGPYRSQQVKTVSPIAGWDKMRGRQPINPAMHRHRLNKRISPPHRQVPIARTGSVRSSGETIKQTMAATHCKGHQRSADRTHRNWIKIARRSIASYPITKCVRPQASLSPEASGESALKVAKSRAEYHRSVSTDERVDINSCRKAGMHTQCSAYAWESGRRGTKQPKRHKQIP
jgi:hypothetical protein